MNKRFVLISIISLLLIGVVTVLFIWNKPHTSAWNAKLAAQGSPDAILQQFFASPDKNATEWTDRAIAITGTPTAAPNAAVLEFKTQAGIISCALSENTEPPNPGQKVELRGIFTGFDQGIPGFDDMMPSIYLIRCDWKSLSK